MNKEESRKALEKMPVGQLREIARLLALYPEATWHINDCGCCACVHPRGQKGHNQDAYLINSSGDSEYLTRDDIDA